MASLALAAPCAPAARTPARERSLDGTRPQALPSLTGLRFVAALWVVGLHYGQGVLAASGAPRWMQVILSHGYVGVSLFFVLSGFILGRTYLDQGGRMRGTARAFWRARASRIYPVYLLTLVLSTLPLLWSGAPAGTPALSWPLALLSLSLLQSWVPGALLVLNGPGWSVSTEAFFYALFPVLAPRLASYGRSRGHLFALGALLWAASLLPALLYLWWGGAPNAAHWESVWGQVLAFNPLSRLPEFALGIVAACLCAHHGGRVPHLLAPVCLLLCGLVLARDLPYPLLTHGLLAPLFALLLYGLSASGTPGARGRRDALTAVLGCPLLVRLGEASYALYLLQAPVWALLLHVAHVGDEVAHHTPVFVLLDGGVLLCASVLVGRLVEEPARRALRGGSRHAQACGVEAMRR